MNNKEKNETFREKIARRAYEIYLGHPGNEGLAEQDWLQAEAEFAAAALTDSQEKKKSLSTQSMSGAEKNGSAPISKSTKKKTATTQRDLNQ
jgi:hypothetical protein